MIGHSLVQEPREGDLSLRRRTVRIQRFCGFQSKSPTLRRNIRQRGMAGARWRSTAPLPARRAYSRSGRCGLLGS